MIGLILPLLFACGGPEQPAGTPCDAENPCPFGESCVDAVCVAEACSTSAQCAIEHFCDGGTCVPGCREDLDCLPGYACDLAAGTCVEDACEDTKVDCGFKEFCNTATGDCYDAGEQYCKPCTADTQCSEDGESAFCYAGYCTVNCEGGKECPAGFECVPFGDQYGNIVTYQCFTYCWLYEDYDPGSF